MNIYFHSLFAFLYETSLYCSEERAIVAAVKRITNHTRRTVAGDPSGGVGRKFETGRVANAVSKPVPLLVLCTVHCASLH